MPFYVPVGPRGILFRLGMTWTRLLGALTYWSRHHRPQKKLAFGVYPTLYSPVEQPSFRALDSPITTDTGRSSAIAQTVAVPIRAILQFDSAATGKIESVTEKRVAPDELERIRDACARYHADEEMTELVLASHRRDRTKLSAMLEIGESLDDYVQYKLAIWEAILSEEATPPSQDRSTVRDSLPAQPL